MISCNEYLHRASRLLDQLIQNSLHGSIHDEQPEDFLKEIRTGAKCLKEIMLKRNNSAELFTIMVLNDSGFKIHGVGLGWGGVGERRTERCCSLLVMSSSRRVEDLDFSPLSNDYTQ